MTEQEQRQAEQQEMQRKQRLRQSALMIAEDKHGNDPAIIKLKHELDDAMLSEKKFQDDLRALQMDTQLARAKFEKALDAFIDDAYRMSEDEWKRVFARFKRA